MPATLADLVTAHRDTHIEDRSVSWHPSRGLGRDDSPTHPAGRVLVSAGGVGAPVTSAKRQVQCRLRGSEMCKRSRILLRLRFAQ